MRRAANESTKLFNAAATAAPPERVVHPDAPRSRVPDRVVVHPVVVGVVE